MPLLPMYSRRLVLFVSMAGLAGLLCACGARPTLESKAAKTPAGIDLSGDWVLQGNAGDEQRSRASSGADSIFIPPRQSRRQRTRGIRGPQGESVAVFLEFGQSLKITQTPYGMFVSYDRSVVEEYTFGENRLVTVGPIEAQRVSGWEAGRFVVETLDRQGNLLVESWALAEGGDRLLRRAEIAKGEKLIQQQELVYEREK